VYRSPWFQCSSASRKFLNAPRAPQRARRALFQCSSASRKFLNRVAYQQRVAVNGFSALQRAENSSIWLNHAQPVKTESVSVLFSEPKIPQSTVVRPEERPFKFQCSSASRKFLNAARSWKISVMSIPFQCSSASRKFLKSGSPTSRAATREFQCSSASRKFLNWNGQPQIAETITFQCSSASRKFLNVRPNR